MSVKEGACKHFNLSLDASHEEIMDCIIAAWAQALAESVNIRPRSVHLPDPAMRIQLYWNMARRLRVERGGFIPAH